MTQQEDFFTFLRSLLRGIATAQAVSQTHNGENSVFVIQFLPCAVIRRLLMIRAMF